MSTHSKYININAVLNDAPCGKCLFAGNSALFMKGTLPAPATVLLKLNLPLYFPAVLAAVVITPLAG